MTKQTKPLSILEQIIEGSKRGYLAVTKELGMIVPFVVWRDDLKEDLVCVLGRLKSADRISKHDEIVRWIYVGSLFGTPTIPEGARFKVRDNSETTWLIGEEFKVKTHDLDTVEFVGVQGEFSLSELTPIF